MKKSLINNPNLIFLDTMFEQNGYELYIVGGACRDMILGITPKDIDLATSATPDEQVELYKKYNIRYIETGLQHGTITVVIDDETYEITTYRIDTETDGRHALVNYTRDILVDLSRRDFSFNALAMNYKGDLIDPYHGQDDLAAGVVRFVGNADDRIKEDYLRILRFFRFYQRYGKGNIDPATFETIRKNVAGLLQISRERVWLEMKAIFAGERVNMILFQMSLAGVQKHIDMPNATLPTDDLRQVWNNLNRLAAACETTKNPITRMALYFESRFQQQAERWKLSNQEIKHGEFILKYKNISIRQAKELLTEGESIGNVVEALQVAGNYYPSIETWNIPVFPITGYDLMDQFSGPALGKELKRLRQVWYDSNFNDEVVGKKKGA